MNEEIINKLIKFAPYIGTVLAFVLGFYKDTILTKLNIKNKRADLEMKLKDKDTIYINNSQKLVEIYSDSMSDLRKIHQQNVKEIEKRFNEEREHDKKKDELREKRLKMSIKKEKELSETLKKFSKEVEKLKNLVHRLQKQIEFYKEHSDLELPNNLK